MSCCSALDCGNASIITGDTAMAEEKPTPKTLIKKFFALQEERVQTYNLFEDGFQAYLRGAPNYNFPMYRKLVNEITQAFQGISRDIISIEKNLTDTCGLSLLGSIVNKIQDEEKKKLEHTAQLQITRQNVVDHSGTDYKEEVNEFKQRITECIENINELMEELKYESEDLYNDTDMER